MKNKLFKRFFGKTGFVVSKVFFIYLLSAGLIFLINIVIARFFGKEYFGIYSYFFGLANLIYLFAVFGCNNSIAKLIARNKLQAKDLIFKNISLVFMFSIFFSVVGYLIAEYFNLNPSLPYFGFLVFLFVLLISWFTVLTGVLRGFRKFTSASFFLVINRIFLIIGVLVIALLLRNFILILAATSVATLLTYPFIYSDIKRALPENKERVSFKYVLKNSFMFFLVGVSLLSLYFIDRISIRYVLSFSDLGQYSSYATIINVIRVAAYAIPFVLISKSVTIKYQIGSSVKKILSALIPFAVFVGFASYVLVPILFGQEFVIQSVWLPWAIVLSCSLLVIYSFFNSIFVGEGGYSSGHIKILSIDAGLSLLLNLFLNIILIRQIGIIGAPIATSAVLVLKIGLNVYGLKRERQLLT